MGLYFDVVKGFVGAFVEDVFMTPEEKKKREVTAEKPAAEEKNEKAEKSSLEF